jgi:predicted membrane-bound spermidine synthase
MFLGLSILVGKFPDGLDKSLAFAVVGPILCIGSLIAGYLSGAITRSVVEVIGTVAAVVAALAVAALLTRPVDGADAPRTYLTLAALSGILAGAGHLIAVAFRPRAIRA